MTLCPNCNAENIEGTDNCVDCGQPLDDTTLPPPKNEVERTLLQDHISVLAPNTPIAVDPTTPLGDVLRLMVNRNIGCVIVAEGQQPVGIFSERDALHKVNTEAKAYSDRPVSEFMTPKPETEVADAKIAFAVRRMDLGSYRHLPIVSENGDLVGTISARDILRHLTETMASESS